MNEIFFCDPLCSVIKEMMMIFKLRSRLSIHSFIDCVDRDFFIEFSFKIHRWELDDLSFFGDYFHPKRIEERKQEWWWWWYAACLFGNSHTENIQKKNNYRVQLWIFFLMEKTTLGQLKQQQPVKPANR